MMVFNSNYYMPALVLLQSLQVNNRWCREIRVYVLYSDLKPDEIRRFSQVAEKSGIARAIFLPVGADQFQDAPLPRDTIYFNAGTQLYDLAGQRREIELNILYEYPVLFYKQLK